MAGTTLEDRCGRGFAHLRLSITPACNFHCVRLTGAEPQPASTGG